MHVVRLLNASDEAQGSHDSGKYTHCLFFAMYATPIVVPSSTEQAKMSTDVSSVKRSLDLDMAARDFKRGSRSFDATTSVASPILY